LTELNVNVGSPGPNPGVSRRLSHVSDTGLGHTVPTARREPPLAGAHSTSWVPASTARPLSVQALKPRKPCRPRGWLGMHRPLLGHRLANLNRHATSAAGSAVISTGTPMHCTGLSPMAFLAPWPRAPTQRLGDHRCSLPVAGRIEQDLHGRQWQHGDTPATDDDSVHMVQVRSGDYHVARWAYGLNALQDLDPDAVDHGEGPADGANVSPIPACLVAHHRAPQPVDQLGRGHVINQEIQVPGIDRQSMQGQGGASADSPPAAPDNGQLTQGRTPRWC